MSLFKNFIRKIKVHISNSVKKSPYVFVSLGPNCYPRTVLTRVGLIKHKKEGQKTYPFDFAWFHKAKYVTEFLNNNFENFLSELKYSDFSSSWDNGEKINFSHEAYIGPNEKNKLIKVYKRRINNFLNDIKQDKPFIFLQILKDRKVGEDCLNTYSALKNLLRNKKFVYVVVDFMNIIPNNLPSEIKFIKLSLPSDDTDVFSKEFYLSEDGMKTENEISEFIKNVIKNEFNITPVKFL